MTHVKLISVYTSSSINWFRSCFCCVHSRTTYYCNYYYWLVGGDPPLSYWALFLRRYPARKLIGSAGLSLARLESACSNIGTTVWSRYCLVGSDWTSTRDFFGGTPERSASLSIPITFYKTKPQHTQFCYS